MPVFHQDREIKLTNNKCTEMDIDIIFLHSSNFIITTSIATTIPASINAQYLLLFQYMKRDRWILAVGDNNSNEHGKPTPTATTLIKLDPTQS